MRWVIEIQMVSLGGRNSFRVTTPTHHITTCIFSHKYSWISTLVFCVGNKTTVFAGGAHLPRVSAIVMSWFVLGTTTVSPCVWTVSNQPVSAAGSDCPPVQRCEQRSQSAWSAAAGEKAAAAGSAQRSSDKPDWPRGASPAERTPEEAATGDRISLRDQQLRIKDMSLCKSTCKQSQSLKDSHCSTLYPVFVLLQLTLIVLLHLVHLQQAYVQLLSTRRQRRLEFAHLMHEQSAY